jgi:aminoglycoside phosphotransferase family enzyme/predicted kinase
VIPDAQRPVAELLARLTGAAPIETHISAVFVGRDDAFKLKKAVTLPFLDFAPLAAREHFCRRELALNAPNAPGIYRDVLPVTRAPDGSLSLCGQGEVVDWVLRMAPVPPGDFLDAVAARGGLDGSLLDAVADATLDLLARAPVVAGVDSAARMRAVLAGNLEGCLAAGLDPARVAAVGAAMAARLDALAPGLAARAASGCVRRCHGDLHLGNLCLWDGRPVAFDALEFDEAYATTDIGYEVAFLLMDLDVRVSRAAANRVMNRLMARAPDAGMLAALPFWMAQRALVRAKLEPARGRDPLPYLAAAERYMLPAPPRLVAVGGLQGTGKTFVARGLAPGLGAAPGALHLRSDEIRKRRAGIAPEARLPPDAYRPEESAAVHAEMFALARAALAAGRSVVLDAMFLDPAMRAAAEAAAETPLGPHPFAGFWLEAPLGLLRARVAGRTEAGDRAPAGRDASDATVEVLERAAAADPGPITWARLDAAGDAAGQAAAALALNRDPGA